MWAGWTLRRFRSSIHDSDERLGAEQIAFVEAAARAVGRDHLGFELARTPISVVSISSTTLRPAHEPWTAGAR